MRKTLAFGLGIGHPKKRFWRFCDSSSEKVALASNEAKVCRGPLAGGGSQEAEILIPEAERKGQRKRRERAARWRQSWRRQRPLLVMELAKRKLIRLVQDLKGPELMNLINRDGRRSRVLEYLPEERNCFCQTKIVGIHGLWNGLLLYTLESTGLR
jgi:hypothetical protein